MSLDKDAMRRAVAALASNPAHADKSPDELVRIAARILSAIDAYDPLLEDWTEALLMDHDFEMQKLADAAWDEAERQNAIWEREEIERETSQRLMDMIDEAIEEDRLRTQQERSRQANAERAKRKAQRRAQLEAKKNE